MPAPAILQALTALIPSLPATNKPFPPALISQCESLLALSRQRASNLKPEEEIARAHACAEIACKTLRAQLRLPAIKNGAGAPCNPRTYKKLITFLEKALADAPVGSATPQGRKRGADGSIKQSGGTSSKRTALQQNGIEDTPSKKRIVDRPATAGFTGLVKNSKKKKQKESSTATEGLDKSPDFIMPSIRKLCKEFSTSQMVPHVYTGTCVVLGLAGLWPLGDEDDIDEESKAEYLTLVIALYLMTLTRMKKGNMTLEIYNSVSEKGLELLGLQLDALDFTEEWVTKLNSEKWCDGQDWWTSVPEDVLIWGVAQDSINGEADEEEDTGVAARRRRQRTADARKSDMEQDDPDGLLLPGLGTMLHEGVDWTSEDRRLDFEDWRSGLLKRINTMEKGSRRSEAVASA